LYGKCVKIRHVIIRNTTHNTALGFNQYNTTRPKFTPDNKLWEQRCCNGDACGQTTGGCCDNLHLRRLENDNNQDEALGMTSCKRKGLI